MALATEPATDLETYYVSVSNKTGDAIVTSLHDKIDGHTSISYSGLEPYYAKTDLTTEGKIWDMYSTCSFTTKDANCQQSRVCDCWNKEHSIPQSWFNEGSPMKSDLFHVVPTDARVNNFRSNLPYGETSSTAYIDNNSHSLGHLGSSNFSGYSGKVYEPDDEYKGDFARTYMYMVVRYMDKNFTQSNEGKVMFSYNSGATIKNTFTSYSVSLLMKWHRQDPVSQKEIDRNNAVYGIQNNRNPFIDYPYLAEFIWGEKKGTKFTFDQVISAYDSSFELGVSDGSRVSTDPQLIVPTTSLTLGPVLAGETARRSITLTARNLTSGITVSVNNSAFSVSPASIPAATANGTHTITISYMPETAGTASATLTIASAGAESLSVALSGRCAERRTITWMVSGQTYTLGDPTATVADGGMPKVLPTAPSSCDPDRVFVGWSATSLATATDVVPEDLFSDESEVPVIYANTTFYAVFARQAGTASVTDSLTVSMADKSEVSTLEIGNVATAVFDQGGNTNSPKYYVSGDAVRLYGGGTLTISSESPISSISFGTFDKDKTANTLSVSTGSWNQSSATWTGEANSVVFTVGGSSGHVKLNKIRVTTGGGVTYDSFVTTLPCSPVHTALPAAQQRPDAAEKVLIDGKLYIIRNNETYDIYGRR